MRINILMAIVLTARTAFGQETPAQFEQRVERFLLLIEGQKGDLDRLGPPNEVTNAMLRILERNLDNNGTARRLMIKTRAISYLGDAREKRAGPMIASVVLRKGFHADQTADRAIRTSAALALARIGAREHKGVLIRAYDEADQSEFSIRFAIAQGLANVVEPSDRAFIARLEQRERSDPSATRRAKMAQIVAVMKQRVP